MASMLRASVLNTSVFATAEAIAWRIRSSRTRVVYVACADGFGLLPAPRSSPMIGSASHRSPGLVRIHTGSCAWTLAISHGVPALTGAVREAKHCSSPRSDNRNAMWQDAVDLAVRYRGAGQGRTEDHARKQGAGAIEVVEYDELRLVSEFPGAFA